jgi:hypothetical protein
MNKNYYTTLYFIIAIGFSQRVTNKIYRALAKNKDLVFISILLNSYGIQFKESFQKSFAIDCISKAFSDIYKVSVSFSTRSGKTTNCEF